MHATAPPTMDGTLDEWGGVNSLQLNATESLHTYLWGETPTIADLSAELRSAWTVDNLYFAVAIQDDVLVGNNSEKIWGDDVVEISIHDPISNSTHQFTIAADGRQAKNGNPFSALNVVTSTISGGWSVEIAVPASALGEAEFASGQQYALNFGLWDDDRFTYPGQTHLIWRSVSTNIFKADWGDFRLDDASYDFSKWTPPPARHPHRRGSIGDANSHRNSNFHTYAIAHTYAAVFTHLDSNPIADDHGDGNAYTQEHRRLAGWASAHDRRQPG